MTTDDASLRWLRLAGIAGIAGVVGAILDARDAFNLGWLVVYLLFTILLWNGGQRNLAAD